MTPRQKAQEAGEKKYEGNPCKICGGTQRYAADRKCVRCMRARKLRDWRRRPGEERNRLSAEWKAKRQQFAKDCRRMELMIDVGGLDPYLAQLDADRRAAYARYANGLEAAKLQHDRAVRKLVPGGRGMARRLAEHERERRRLDKELEKEYKRLDGWEKRARAYYLEKNYGTRT